jgi:dephospho-CoA kinase
VLEFGSEYLQADGELDRKKLGALVFSNAEARSRLNRIMRWPILIELLKCIVLEFLKGSEVVVIEAPLLYERGMDRYMWG